MENSDSMKSVKSLSTVALAKADVVQFLRLRLAAICQRSRCRESATEAKSDKDMDDRSVLMRAKKQNVAM